MLFTSPEWYEDGRNPFYVEGEKLEAGIGNNGFSMEKRERCDQLLITPMKNGSFEDLHVGGHIAFQDFDMSGKWQEWFGLEWAILCLDYEVPVYVVDNHNHVFYCWVEALKAGWIQKGATLVHMDAHFDDRKPPNPLKGGLNASLKEVWRYTNEVLQIATYIQPALELGLFSEVVNMVESCDFEPGYLGLERVDRISGDIILNVDLDVFCSDMDHISYGEKVDAMRRCLSRTKLITFATSPSFIKQEKAIQICKRVVGGLVWF